MSTLVLWSQDLQVHLSSMECEPPTLPSGISGEVPPGDTAHLCLSYRCPVHGERRPQHQWLSVLYLHNKDRLVSASHAGPLRRTLEEVTVGSLICSWPICSGPVACFSLCLSERQGGIEAQFVFLELCPTSAPRWLEFDLCLACTHTEGFLYPTFGKRFSK